MWSILDDLDAFLQENRRCGELDTGLDGERVWMTCGGCGAELAGGGDPAMAGGQSPSLRNLTDDQTWDRCSATVDGARRPNRQKRTTT